MGVMLAYCTVTLIAQNILDVDDCDIKGEEGISNFLWNKLVRASRNGQRCGSGQ
jgi:hypothetical protein